MPTTIIHAHHSSNHSSSSEDSSASSSTSNRVSSASLSESSADNDIGNDADSSIDHYVETEQHSAELAAADDELPPSPIASLACSLVLGVSCTVTGVALAIVHGLRLGDPTNRTAPSDAAYTTVGGMLAAGGVGCIASGVINYFCKSQIPACATADPA